MKKSAYFLLLVLLAVSSGCQKAETWHKSTLLYFDTVCEFNLFCSASTFATAQEKINQTFAEIENRFAPGKSDLSSRWALDLFQKAKEVYLNSNGCFDITVTPLSQLWGFLSGSHTIPDQKEISSTLELIGMERIEVKDGEIFLSPGMSLDWGGVAKGFGIDIAAKALVKLGISKGFVNAGGDLYCWGSNPDEKPWQIGIKHPRRSGFLGVLSISGLGAATTGDYQRFFIKNGVRYHHVFDPRTGRPARSKQSVTVIGPEACLCDALSTAVFVSKAPAHIMERFPEYGAIIVNSEGEISSLGKSYSFFVWE